MKINPVKSVSSEERELPTLPKREIAHSEKSARPEQASITNVKPSLEESQATDAAQTVASQVTEISEGSLQAVGALDQDRVAKLLEDD